MRQIYPSRARSALSLSLFFRTTTTVVAAVTIADIFLLGAGSACASIETEQKIEPSVVTTLQVPKSSDDALPERWALHGQITNVTQRHPRFTSPYAGTNSLIANGRPAAMSHWP